MPAFTGHTTGLDTLASSGSCHPREGCRLPLNIGFLPLPVDPSRWPAPFAPRALHRFIATTKQSAPARRIGTFGLAVGAACAFSLGVADQVLTFHTKAWSSFAPPTCRMPPGPYQASPGLIPEE